MDPRKLEDAIDDFFARATAYFNGGQPNEAIETLEKLLAELAPISEPTFRERAVVHLNLGDVHGALGDLVAAEVSYRRALTLFERLKDPTQEQAGVHQTLGNVYRARGDLVAAEVSYCRALTLFQDVGTPWDQAVIHRNLGVVLHARGDLVAAKMSYRRALMLFEDVGTPRDQAVIHQNLGAVYRDRGDLVAAEASYYQALRLYAGVAGALREQAGVYQNLGNIHGDRGDLVAAEASYRFALGLYEDVDGSRREQAIVHQNLGVLHRDRGELVAAEASYRFALALFADLDDSTCDQADVYQNIGVVHGDRGDFVAASECLNTSRAAYSSLGLLHRVLEVDAVVARLRVAQADAAADTAVADRYLAEALALVVPAALNVDVRRFQFARERERMTWAAEIAAPTIRLAFNIATRVGDAAAVADLIAHSRASGIAALGADSGAGSDLGRGALDIMLTAAAASAGSVDDGGDVGDELTAGIAVSSGLGLDGLIRRNPTPPLRMPDGRTALQREHPNTERTEVHYL